MELASLLIAFIASLAGAICGIGGGIIIKPALDMAGAASLPAANFLSNCTVFAMSLVSVGGALASKRGGIDTARGTPLAAGAVLGGAAGGWLFGFAKGALAGAADVAGAAGATGVADAVGAVGAVGATDAAGIAGANTLGAIQSASMLLLTAAAIAYAVLSGRGRAAPRNVQSKAASLGAGLALGAVSGFLGIGGGPVNLMVLSWLFSMDAAAAAKNSLYIILFSQAANLIGLLVTRSVPAVEPALLLAMILGGALGGAAGRLVNRRIGSVAASRLFMGLMIAITCICAYNTFRFWRGMSA
jgi:uncharacterized membrane protein YfcA